MEKEIKVLCEAIVSDYLSWQLRCSAGAPRTEIQARMYDEFANGVRIEEGSKYIKIICGTSVWGFINKGNKKFKVGDILKAASWRAPAVNKARGNILEGGYDIKWTGPNYLI